MIKVPLYLVAIIELWMILTDALYGFLSEPKQKHRFFLSSRQYFQYARIQREYIPAKRYPSHR